MNLRDSIKKHEGYREFPYDDEDGKTVVAPKGKLTIGYGWNLQDNPLPQAIAEMLLDIGIANAERVAKQFVSPAWNLMPETVQEVLIEMAYNMGGRLYGFRRLRAALVACHYELAAAEMLKSAWAKQVGKRALSLADRVRGAGSKATRFA